MNITMHKALFERFHLNGNTTGSYPQTHIYNIIILVGVLSKSYPLVENYEPSEITREDSM